MSYEKWLKYRNMDASKKIFVVIGIIVFDFLLFIGEHILLATIAFPVLLFLLNSDPTWLYNHLRRINRKSYQ